MLFTEPSFLFYFLPALLLLHALAPTGFRNALLTAASLVFYAWGEPVFVAGLAASIAVNHAIARAMAAAGPRAGGRLCGAGVAANLAFLALFKYAGFVSTNVDGALVALGAPGLPDALLEAAPGLPIGISFFTFQAISLLVDLRRGSAPLPRHALDTALYIAMFPQLIAGPIVRYADLAPQLFERSVGVHDLAAGARRFTIGLVKKLWLAEIVAVPADRVFALAEPGGSAAIPGLGLTAGTAWFGLTCFALQIYLDFSAYSDMAIGLARMFGFRYRENFAYPYTARSLTEFWRRWHISLSTWFRDYLYIPLGGSRRARARVAANLTLVFLLCGLWHGAAWTFLAWGALHGIGLAAERVLPIERMPRGAAPLRHALTLLFVTLAWVPFRSASMHVAATFSGALFGFGSGAAEVLGVIHLLDPRLILALLASIVVCHPAPGRWCRLALDEAQRKAAGPAVAIEIAVLTAALVLCAARIAAGGYQPFLYFRF